MPRLHQHTQEIADRASATATLAAELRRDAWTLAADATGALRLPAVERAEALGQFPAFVAALAKLIRRNDPSTSASSEIQTTALDPLLRKAAAAHAEQRIAQRATAREVIEEFARLRRSLSTRALGDDERSRILLTVINPTLDLVIGEVVDQFHGQATSELRHRAERDPLTGLLNRAAFTERLGRELAHAERHGRELTIVTLDLDAFKDVNDTLGHLTGDAVLKRIADLLTTHTREHDLVARVGGDEFVVALTETDARAARNLVRRVRIHLAPTRRQLQLPAAFGVSYGCASFPEDGRTIDELLAGADTKMYRDKDPSRAAVSTPVHLAPNEELPTDTHERINVLVVDDDPSMRDLCTATLEQDGFAVTTAVDGFDALTAMSTQPPDAVILDVRMPHLDGWGVSRRMAEDPDTANIPIIMLTGLTDPTSIGRADSVGASDYVAKPFDPRQLTDALHRVLEMREEQTREQQRALRRAVAR